MAGIVVEVGANLKDKYAVGDEVHGLPPFLSIGAFAEYFNIDAAHIARKPKNLSFDEVVGVPLAGQTGMQVMFDRAKLKAGETVLILGGSGGTGSIGIQLAKNAGAYVITTTSSRNVEWVKNLGADRVIDYTKENWVDVLEPQSVGMIYDTVVEPESWNTHAQHILKKKEDGAHFVSILPIPNPIESPIGAHRNFFFMLPNEKDTSTLTELAEAGKLKVVIDSVHPFENLKVVTVKQMTDRAQGKIIVHVADA